MCSWQDLGGLTYQIGDNYDHSAHQDNGIMALMILYLFIIYEGLPVSYSKECSLMST